MKKRRAFEERFFEKIKTASHWDNCWSWTGAIDPETGYGRIGLGGRKDGTIGAHRAAFFIFKEFLPDGHEVCHHCDNRWCVNPHHLYAGTRSDNMRDCVSRGRHRGFVKCR